MTISLNEIKTYCRIDGTEDDSLLQALIGAAKEYLTGAGVMEPETDSPLYLLAVKAMVLHFYDHRGMTESGSVSEIPGMQNAVTQLKLQAEAERIVGRTEWPTA